MPYNEIVLRKESFGGILGQRDSYSFHVVNQAGYLTLLHSANQPIQHKNDKGYILFEKKLRDLGFLSDDGMFYGAIIDNGNSVPYMSAPIRVWLEVTSRCNLSCRECLNKNHPEFNADLSLAEIKAILDELYRSGVLQLTITGGEPLIRKDIWDILDYAFELGFGVRFFTNETTLNNTNSELLSRYPISHIFASLDGVGKTNDILRGKGSFNKISRGITNLSRKNSNVTLSVSIHAHSLGNLTQIFDLAKENGIRSLLIRPLFQYTETSSALTLEKSSLPILFALLEEESKRTGVEYQLNKLPFFQNTKSLFLHDHPNDVHFSYFTEYNQFGCVGGNTVAGIKSNGVVMACGFVKYKYDVLDNNVTERKFLDLWNNSNNIKVLRDRLGNEICRECKLLSVCGGGCRANALLHNGSLDAVDPYCFVSNHDFLPEDMPRMYERELLQSQHNVPFLSERTIVTKCGSGSLL